MRSGKHRENEDFQVYDIDVFYNGNFIVTEFFSSIIHSVSVQSFLQGFSPNDSI